jgi:RND superfamily putative drug exporter
MSSFLYRLGQRTARRAHAVIVLWVLVLLVVGGAAAAFGGELRDEFSIPGTESQEGLDVLDTRFPEVSGASGQIVFRSPRGEKIAEHRAEIRERVKALEDVEHVMLVSDPFAEQNSALAISEDGRHALAQVQLDAPVEQLDPEVVEEVAEVATDVSTDLRGDLEVYVGGHMYTPTSVPVSITEAIGVGVALLVLVLTLGSLLAAGIPLLTAILGVGITMAGIIIVASLFTINTSTPSLAMMIGLAVGIDYALFLVARHRHQLSDGMEVHESVARSVATAGSAVIFAGVTVIIALCGLVVARIPFLSVMGLAGAAAVAVAVVIAVTLTPAILSVAGERLRPKQRRRRGRGQQHRIATGWVSLVTRRPLITVVVAVATLLVIALPALDLRLGLNDNGSALESSPERETYDLIEDVYGPGYNSPLLVTADIIRTREPIAVMKDIGREIERLDGVDAVPLTTPNRSADLGIVQVIPAGGQTDAATAELVRELRDRAAALEKEYGVTELQVTGQTAVTIDVSDRLAGALLPFGLVVVGLSLVLLMVVFRSVAVPVKATLGYLLSVAASFGAVVAVFDYGWFAELLNVERPGPVLSFLPIMLMGVLFGLAMDYEVFLVSRMREHWVHHGDAREAISHGFAASARVVVAAAVIMVSVFASFVPHGDASVKPIAFGLAIGVLIDAFLVRMTLVPAVMALLGERAWGLPPWLDRLLPSLDVEGEGLGAHLEHEAWVAEHGAATVRVEGLALDTPVAGAPILLGVDLVVRPGEVAVLTGEPVARRALLAVLSGRLRPDHGTVAVLDRILPSESAAVRAKVAPCGHIPRPAVRRVPELLLLDLDEVGADEATALREHAAAGTAVIVATGSDPLPLLTEVPDAVTLDLVPHGDREEALL